MNLEISHINESVRTQFEKSKRVLSFRDFLNLVNENPLVFLRNSFDYLLDAINHFGEEEIPFGDKQQTRYKIFDQKFSEVPRPLVGQEELQNKFVKILTGYVRAGKATKLIVLHGPNGSAKSTFVKNLFNGLETYSHTTEGRMFNFSWVFPKDTQSKSHVGIASVSTDNHHTESYANLDQDRIGALLRSELHENPLFLIPKDQRLVLFEKWKQKYTDPKDLQTLERLKNSFLKGELSHKNAMVFEALLNEYRGDFEKVIQHVRVERLYLSTRFRKGLVSIDAQFGIDASIRQVTLDQSMAMLPAALQSLNLFQLEGDLIDGNRGIVEYNDLLKRPVEAYKYLLNTTENNTASLGNVVVFIDTIFIATTNDRQLEAFREHPEFYSFKSRLEMIRVPYLLKYSDEEKIYQETIARAVSEKEVLPHTSKALALWAVMTRLKKPLTKDKEASLSRVLEKITPLEKAKLYNSGELPHWLNEEDRKNLKPHIDELYKEHRYQIYYEGLLGASARELKMLIQIAAQNHQFKTLGPMAVFHELKQLVQKKMDFDYLRLEPVDQYHHFEAFIDVVKNEWLDWVDSEMRSCLALHKVEDVENLLNRYFEQLIPYIKKEKLKNKITGKSENPDERKMKEIEDILKIDTNPDDFRKNLITKLGAWAIATKRTLTGSIPYQEIFPDLIQKISSHHQKQEEGIIKDLGKAVLNFGKMSVSEIEKQSTLNESQELAVKAYQGLQEKYGYGPQGALEALVELVRTRYR